MTTVSRRGFIGSAAAFAGAALVPSWHTFKQRKVIDLTPFCDDGEPTRRYDLTKPFAQDGMVYGCDARICVRTLLADAPELSDETRLPPCSVLPGWNQETKWRKWPARKLFSDDTENMCPICWGRGGLSGLSKCGPCEGTGYTDIEMTREEVEKFYDQWDGEPSYEMPCKDCRGTGWQSVVLCDYCEGKGWTRRASLLRVGDEVIAGHYDARIRALGDVEFCVADTHCIRFRGEEFEGLVMGIDMARRTKR